MRHLTIALTLAALAAHAEDVSSQVLVRPIKPLPKPTPHPMLTPGSVISGQVPRPRPSTPAQNAQRGMPLDQTVLIRKPAKPVGDLLVKKVVPLKPPLSEHDRKVAACKAAKGAWQVEVRGVKLSAKGSDVDEIYGSIYVSNTGGGVYHSARGGTGWQRNYLWASNDNVNLEGNPNIYFPRLQITNIYGGERYNAKVRVHFKLYDEDDGRGGSNDEFFIASGPIGANKGADNSLEYKYLITDCDEQPEFSRGFQETMFGMPYGQGEKNKVTFVFTLRAFREFP